MKLDVIHAELEAEASEVEIWLNDIPIGRLGLHGMNRFSYPVETALVEGRNALELVVWPGIMPSVSRTNKGERSFKTGSAQAGVLRYRVGGFTGDPNAEVLSQIKYDCKSEPDEYPKKLQAYFNLPPSGRRWAWEQAKPVELSEVRAELLALLKSLHASFLKGEPGLILSMLDRFFDDESRAYPDFTHQQMRSATQTAIANNAKRRHLIDPFEESKVDLRVCAGGRMVECVLKDWRPVLEARVDEQGVGFPLPMFLGYLDGRWQILR